MISGKRHWCFSNVFFKCFCLFELHTVPSRFYNIEERTHISFHSSYLQLWWELSLKGNLLRACPPELLLSSICREAEGTSDRSLTTERWVWKWAGGGQDMISEVCRCVTGVMWSLPRLWEQNKSLQSKCRGGGGGGGGVSGAFHSPLQDIIHLLMRPL